MIETRPGVHFWQAAHPDWEPGSGWEQLVTSYVLGRGDWLLVIDPLAPPPELNLMATGRAVTIVVTCGWHRRDADALAARLSAALFVPVPDPAHPDPGARQDLHLRRLVHARSQCARRHGAERHAPLG